MRYPATPIASLLVVISAPAMGETVREFSVPVYAGDVDQPYVVIGEIHANLRKHFAFQPDPSKEKIYSELWERGKRMGADAVIRARYGTTVRTLFNHGKTPISGLAVRFQTNPSGKMNGI